MPVKRGPYVRSAATRARLLALLAERPGMTRADLQRATGLAWGTVAHHLRSMLERGEVEASRFGRRAHYVVKAKDSGPGSTAPMMEGTAPRTQR